jgi:hypothetical protein
VCTQPWADTPAIGVAYCGCDGVSFTDGWGFSHRPYRHQGLCAGDADAGARVH